jgi:peptidoglycan/LPS O-acetylase OafA/YrhL
MHPPVISPTSPITTHLHSVDAATLQAAVSAPRISGLDALRAIAVLFVVWGHATEEHFGEQIALSSLGVKIFFVLSGFLITRLLLDEQARHGRIDFWGFYRRRAARLMPAFYLFLATGLTVLWLRHKPIPWDPVVASLLYVTNYYQAYTGAQTNLVAHCWSLAVEEQFYLLWPVLLAYLLRQQTSLAKALVYIVLGVWCWRWWVLISTDASIHYLYRALETRADDLAVGCLLSVLLRAPTWRERLAHLLRLPGLAPLLLIALFASTAYGTDHSPYRYAMGFMIEPLMIALLVLMAVVTASGNSVMSRLLNHPLVVHIGQVSYGIYLFHGLVGYSAQRVVEQNTGSFWFGVAAAFASVILVASASFRWFETPMRRWISGSSH